MFRKFSRKRISAATALTVAGVALGMPATTFAQMLEEVVVTAQKRSQSIQDVSMSLSAFSSDALNDRVIEDMADLQFSVPNLVDDGARITIRGVGNNAISSTAEGGLGYHVNGVYVNRAQTRSTDYFDVERIEVLRGPQGTLYGRNTTAGVINIITRKPGEELGGDLSFTVGNYNSTKAKGAINIPLTDNIRQRFAGSYQKRDGYQDNIYNGNDIDGRDSYELRSSTAFDFGENTTADLVISYLNEDSTRASQSKGTCTKDLETGCSALSAGFETPDMTNSGWQGLHSAFLGYALWPAGDYYDDAVNPADFRKVNISQDPTYEVEQLGVSLEINYQMGDYKLTSLTGYYDTDSDVFADFQGFASNWRMNFPITYRANAKDYETTDEIKSGRRDTQEAEQITQEFRIASEFDGNFNFLLGAFYYNEESTRAAIFTHPVIAFTQQQFGLDEQYEWYAIEGDPVDTTSYALFGETYFDLSEKTRLTVGLRYTDDEKTSRSHGPFLPPYVIDDVWVEAEDDWQETTGKVTVEHFMGEDSMVFATIARGYKAGGLNPSGPLGGETFDPEYINQFEVGSKNTFMDGRLRANFGAFYYDYEGLQIGKVAAFSAITVNADSEVKGAEAEFVFAATDAWELNLNLSWLDMQLNDFESADGGDPNGIDPNTKQALDENGDPAFTPGGDVIKDLDGNSLRNAPEWSANIGVAYNTEVVDGYGLTARLNHFWQDEYYANEYAKNSDVIDSWEQTDAQLILEPASGSWALQAYVKNIADNDDVIRRGQDGSTGGRFRSVTVLEPRTYGLELRIFFE